MLEIISPNKIGEFLGIKGETIARFATDEYGLTIPKSGGEYISIQHSLRNSGAESKYYADYFYYTSLLKELKGGTLGLFGDFNFKFLLDKEYRDEKLIEEIMREIVLPQEAKIKKSKRKTKIIAAIYNRGIPKTPKFSGEAPRRIWMTQQDYEHILAGQKAKPMRFGIFGIPIDDVSIGNFIFKAIKRFPVVKTEISRYPGSKVYIYEIRRSGDINYLHLVVDGDGHIVTAFSTESIQNKGTFVKN